MKNKKETNSSIETEATMAKFKLNTLSSSLLGLFTGLVLALMLQQVVQIGRVTGESMMSTYKDGERVIIYKLDKTPEKGDVVALKNTEYGDKLLIKRVIATEGDTIEMVDGIVYINGIEQEEAYVDENLITDNFDPIVLGEDEIFVMGDNRLNSYDSRIFGVLTNSENLLGVILNPRME